MSEESKNDFINNTYDLLLKKDNIDKNLLLWYININKKYNKKDIPEFFYKNEFEVINKKISNFADSLNYILKFYKLLFSNIIVECNKFEGKIEEIDDKINNNDNSNINQSIEQLKNIYNNIKSFNENVNYIHNYVIKLFQIMKKIKCELGLIGSDYNESISSFLELNYKYIPSTKNSINTDFRDINNNNINNQNMSNEKINVFEKDKEQYNLLNKKRKIKYLDNICYINLNKSKLRTSNNNLINKFAYEINNIDNRNEHSKIIKHKCKYKRYLDYFNIINSKDNKSQICLYHVQDHKEFTKIYNPEEIIHISKNKKYLDFPFKNSKIVNINNTAFVIGGKSLNKEEGNKLIFNIYYNEDLNDSVGNIICKKLSKTLYGHQNHNLLYLERKKLIFILSGINQKSCEYVYYNDKRGILTECKKLGELKEPRENCISLIYNEKFIYLIGGENNANINSYDVCDISQISNNNIDISWIRYFIKPIGFNDMLFNIKYFGMISMENKFYILGGNPMNKNNLFNFKISFSDDEINKNNNSYSKISNIIKLKNPCLINNPNLFFCGQQEFIQYCDLFININMNGKLVRLKKYIFK